jgi:hypothetical protein
VPLSEESLKIVSLVEATNAEIEQLQRTRGMTDQHPSIVELAATRDSLRRRLERQRDIDAQLAGGEDAVVGPPPDAALSPAAVAWQRSRNELDVRISAQEQKIKEVQIDLDANHEAIAQLEQAKTELFDRREEFELVHDRVVKAKQRVAQHEKTLAGIVPAIKTIEQGRLLQFSEGGPASGGVTPISPKSSSIILLALLAGVTAGVIFVVLAELVDGIFRSSGQVARSLGLPVLESIDEIVTGQDRRRLLVQRTVVAPLIVAGCLCITGLTGSMAYLSLQRPWAYERLRTIPQAALDLFVETRSEQPTEG